MGKLSDLLKAHFDKAAGDGDASEVIARMASEADISAGTVNQILSGDIACPPLSRLRGFSRALDAGFDALRKAAEADGCEYDAEGFSVSCALSRKVRVVEMESVRLKSGVRARAIAQRQKQVQAAIAPVTPPPTAPKQESKASKTSEAKEISAELESCQRRALRGDVRDLLRHRELRKSEEQA